MIRKILFVIAVLLLFNYSCSLKKENDKNCSKCNTIIKEDPDSNGIIMTWKVDSFTYKYMVFYNGQIFYQHKYKNGKEEGLWIEWNPITGLRKFEWNYRDGKLDGIERHWYDNGNESIKETWKNGELHGEHYIKTEDGIHYYEKGCYCNDKKNGIWLYWEEEEDSEKVIPTKRTLYLNDSLIYEWYWCIWDSVPPDKVKKYEKVNCDNLKTVKF